VCPRLDPVRRQVEHVGVARLVRGGQAEGQASAVGVEAQMVNHAGKWQLRRRQVLVRAQILDVESPHAALVADECEVVPVARQGEILDVPAARGGDQRFLAGEQIDVA
jgi:hypothetical protein